jgi:GTP-binding protein
MSPPARPTLVIVGRPNVGKSTLFNRITGSRRSIVGDEPGITRDRIRLQASFGGRPFDVIDTGGMLFGETDEFPTLINEQIRAAIDSARQLVFVVDGRTEITATDRDLADFLRRTGKPVTLAVNKCDTAKHQMLAAGFHELGIAPVFPLSAEHALGIDALLDHVTRDFPLAEEQAPGAELIRVAIIGRPNVGKSTLLNQLTGKHRSIVSATPGTTRDAVDEDVERGATTFRFVDTAGIRRKGKTTRMAEKLSVVMAQRHIRLADVVLLLMDATEGVTAGDATIAGYAQEAGRPLLLVVNKWDQASLSQRPAFQQKVRDQLRFLDYAPLVFLSALTGAGTQKLFPLIRKAFRAASRRIPTPELNRFLQSVDFERTSSPGSRMPNIHYVTQPSIRPPTFVFFTSRALKFHFSFERFLANQLRQAFDFEGTPIVIKTKRKRRG